MFKKIRIFVVMKKSAGIDKVRDSLNIGSRNGSRRVPRAPRRWRVEIINENTLARVVRVRLTGIKARVALLAAIASIASLVVVFFTFTPVGRWIWGEKDLRNQYIDMSLKLDSLNAVAAVQEAYVANIAAILSDSLLVDSIIPPTPSAPGDTLLAASEAERQFVERFEAENRFNLSVLSPIAAEGMIFESPVAKVGEGGPVISVYRGTVIGSFVAPDGRFTLVVQHPNDFISSYAGLSDIYVTKGSKVVAGQRIGYSPAPLSFELWRGGTALDPANYIQFPIPETIDK